MSARSNGAPLWWVYPVDGSKSPVLFAGSLADVLGLINALHLESGVQHAAREARD